MVKQDSQRKDESNFNERPARDPKEALFETKPIDEVISTLANAYENKRARQVYEWELLRRNSFHAAV